MTSWLIEYKFLSLTRNSKLRMLFFYIKTTLVRENSSAYKNLSTIFRSSCSPKAQVQRTRFHFVRKVNHEFWYLIDNRGKIDKPKRQLMNLIRPEHEIIKTSRKNSQMAKNPNEECIASGLFSVKNYVTSRWENFHERNVSSSYFFLLSLKTFQGWDVAGCVVSTLYCLWAELTRS